MMNKTSEVASLISKVESLGYEARSWIAPKDLPALDYAAYWNDEQTEQAKEWFWVTGTDFSEMEAYLQRSGLVTQLKRCVDFLEKRYQLTLGGVGCDIAAGVLWAEPHLLAQGRIDKIYCVEMSMHRLLKLGPTLLAHYNVPPEKIALCLGSFYDLKFPPASLDFAFLSAAFHHADEPARLLAEIKRVLKPGGIVIIVQEHLLPSPAKTYARRAVKKMLSTLPVTWQKRFFGKELMVEPLLVSPGELHPIDTESGDHFYFLKDYSRLFSEGGFTFDRLIDRKIGYQSFILRPQGEASALS